MLFPGHYRPYFSCQSFLDMQTSSDKAGSGCARKIMIRESILPFHSSISTGHCTFMGYVA